MSRKINKQEFIEKAKKVHGDKNDEIITDKDELINLINIR